jgi:hypothetical protein
MCSVFVFVVGSRDVRSSVDGLFKENYVLVVKCDMGKKRIGIHFLAVLFSILEQVSITGGTQLSDGIGWSRLGRQPRVRSGDSGFGSSVVGGEERRGRRRDSPPSDPDTLGPHPRQPTRGVGDSSRELGVRTV